MMSASWATAVQPLLTNIKAFRSLVHVDNGSEFKKDFVAFLERLSITTHNKRLIHSLPRMPEGHGKVTSATQSTQIHVQVENVNGQIRTLLDEALARLGPGKEQEVLANLTEIEGGVAFHSSQEFHRVDQ